MPGLVPQVTCGAMSAARSSTVVSNFAPASLVSLLPSLHGFAESLAARDERAAFEIGERGFVGRDHAGARAAFDGHVADGHAASMESSRMASPRVFDDVTGAAADADFADDGQDDVFGGDAGGRLPLTTMCMVFDRDLQQALRGEHVLHFAGADAEGQRAESAVRGSVAVAADDGQAGLGDAQFRAR